MRALLRHPSRAPCLLVQKSVQSSVYEVPYTDPRENHVDPISVSHGDQARRGGMDITISLTPAEAKAVGDGEAERVAEWFHSALWALAILRSGHVPAEPDAPHADARKDHPATPGDWYTVINDLDHSLLPRVEGIRDAAVRAHAELGGSVGDLARAMDVRRSTAQYRREVLQRSASSIWETWAKSGGPQPKF